MNFMWFSSLFKINWLTSELFKKKKKILSGKSKGPKILKKGCDSFSPLLGPSPPSLLYWFNSKWIWVPLPLSTMPALQGQCCSHPWHFRVPAPGYAMTPSLFSVYGPIPSPDSGLLGCIRWWWLTAHSGAHYHPSLSHTSHLVFPSLWMAPTVYPQCSISSSSSHPCFLFVLSMEHHILFAFCLPHVLSQAPALSPTWPHLGLSFILPTCSKCAFLRSISRFIRPEQGCECVTLQDLYAVSEETHGLGWDCVGKWHTQELISQDYTRANQDPKGASLRKLENWIDFFPL